MFSRRSLTFSIIIAIVLTISTAVGATSRTTFIDQVQEFFGVRQTAPDTNVYTYTIPTIFTVNSAADTDDGACLPTGNGNGCTLREAINAANSNPDTNFINFNIAGTGVQTIAPATAFPNITAPVIIDGYTQPNASANTLAVGDNAVILIQINGVHTGFGDNGFHIVAGISTVRGLSIISFTNGINLETRGGNTVEGCFLGTDGVSDLGNRNGVSMFNSLNNTIGGTTPAARNIISGNDTTGVALTTGDGTVVSGNYVGTNAAGTVAVPNGIGINMSGGITIGGSTTGAGNLISGNNGAGVIVGGNAPPPGTVVKGNTIGLKSDGATALSNQTGIIVYGMATQIGGTTATERNVISGNLQKGIDLVDQPGTVIQGNYIGTDSTGISAVGNNGAGDPNAAAINAGTVCTIGGAAAGAGNIISGNGGDAILLIFGNGSTVKGNRIGVNIANAPLGNGRYGVFIRSSNDSVGGTAAGEGNIIAYNADDGVQILQGTGNRIVGNSIFSNGSTSNTLGIDIIGINGVDPNDTGDGDIGPNDLQNFPVITGAPIGGTTVIGTLNSTASSNFSVDVYSNPSCDPSGNGEGAVYLGTAAVVATDGTGNAVFNVTVPTISAGFLTATATNAGGSTSEFSACFAAAAAPTVTLDGAALAFANTTTGNVSATQTKTISGANLIADISCAAPNTDFQVSNNGTIWGPTAVFTQTGGSASGTLSVRFTPQSAGAKSGNVSCTSTGATAANFNDIGTGMAANCAAQPSGMVSWFKGENNALDSRGGSNGTLQNGATFTTGKVGQAFSFAGGSYVSILDTLGQRPASLTVDAWVNITNGNAGTAGVIASKYGGLYNGWIMDSNPSGAISFQLYRDSSNSGGVGTTIPLNTWTHVAGTYDGATIALYVNGALQGSIPFAGGYTSTTTPMTMGVASWNPGYTPEWFSGGVDELEIVNRALTGTEIASIYNASTAGKCTLAGANGSIGWWPGDGDFRDISGNANNGVPFNGAGYDVGKVGQAFSFDGVNDYVQASDAALPSGSSPRSEEFWIRPNAANGRVSTIYGGFSGSSSFYVSLVGNNACIGTWGGGDLCGSANVADLNWHHIALTYDGATARLYVDGTLAASQVRSYNTILNGKLYIGSTVEGSNEYMSGRLDELAFYSRALSLAEVQSVYNAGVAGKYKSASTTAGSNVASNAGGDATITFPSVTAPGIFQQVSLDPATLPALPATSLGLTYDIGTSAVYSGSPVVCFNLPLITSSTVFTTIQVRHLESGTWVDRTNPASINFGSRTVCTTPLTSLSPFALIQTAPTAGEVSLSGRVATAGGNGIRNASVVVTGNGLATPLRAITGAFGYYTVDGLTAGETYVVTVNSKRYTFQTPSRVVSMTDNVTDADFTANP